MRYYFEWDPNKAGENIKKHGISFEQASTVFLDSGMISVFDAEHNESEDRWATMGIDTIGNLLVVIHTFRQMDEVSCNIRIISARKATGRESQQYQEENR